MRRKNESFGSMIKFIAGFLTLVSILAFVPCFADRALAKENGVSLEGSGTLLLYGNFSKEEVREYAGRSDVTKVVAMEGATFPEDCSELFKDFKRVGTFDLSLADTGNVTSMHEMFRGCVKTVSIQLQSFNTSNVTTMCSMFQDCAAVRSLDLSGFDTSNVTDMKYMFGGCNKLSDLDVSHFDTSKVASMQAMFMYCYALTGINLASFDVSNVKKMNNMFFANKTLVTIYVGSDWDVNQVNASDDLFSGCWHLVGGNGTVFDKERVKKDYARIDQPGQVGYFTQIAIPRFTTDLAASYDLTTSGSVTFEIGVDEAVGQYDHKWCVYDQKGKKYSMSKAVELGWLTTESEGEHFDEERILKVSKMTLQMDGKKLACFVKGANGTVRSSVAVIHVTNDERVTIVKQPKDWYGQYGKKASFNVVAEGEGLSYQWQYKKGNTWYDYGLVTADTANFKVTMNEKNVKWAFRCVITDAMGNTVTTGEVFLRLKTEEPIPDGIRITSQPSDWYGRYGQKASFRVTATGEDLSYQWQYKKGTTWNDYAIATADTANFKVTMNEKNVKWVFRCVITDANGKSVTTNEVRMMLTE